MACTTKVYDRNDSGLYRKNTNEPMPGQHLFCVRPNSRNFLSNDTTPKNYSEQFNRSRGFVNAVLKVPTESSSFEGEVDSESDGDNDGHEDDGQNDFALLSPGYHPGKNSRSGALITTV